MGMADSRVSLFLSCCSSMCKYTPLLAAKKQVMFRVRVSKSESKSRPD
jgi:hypothetical protein